MRPNAQWQAPAELCSLRVFQPTRLETDPRAVVCRLRLRRPERNRSSIDLKTPQSQSSQISQSALDLNIAMDGRDARIAAKRARKQKEAEEAAAYERLKQELADRRACIPPTRDPRGTHVGPRRPSQSYDPIWDPRGASRIRGG